MPGTALFGIDVESASEDTLAFVEHGGKLFRDLNVPATWFLTGSTLERYPDVLRGVDEEGFFDLQGHTYNHILLKTVAMQLPKGVMVHNSTDWFVCPGSSMEEIDADLGRCQKLFEQVFGRRAIGMTTPWAYYRGLSDRPDLLEIVRAHGFKALRSFGRNERDCLPVPLEWQPFFYKPQGFPEILECMIHDYQDDFYWEAFSHPGEGETYAGYLKTIADKVARDNLVWSLCSHDHRWASEEGRAEKETWMRPLLEYALGLGIRFVTISQYYDEMIAG